MIQKIMLGMFMIVCIVLMECTAHDQSLVSEQKENNSCKGGMNIQEAIASVLNTGLLCATAGSIAYHVVNKISESPKIWEPLILDCFLGAGFLGCIYTAFFVCKKGQKYRILSQKNHIRLQKQKLHNVDC